MSDAVPRLNAALEGRYAIERELGEGGMATVYLADDLKHQRKVALKVLKPELAAVVGAERFLAEITTTANLTHPHILPLHDSGEADSFLFYVMPFLDGESLRERLDRERQLPVDEAVAITISVAEALDYAHRQGVVHRDIKPANILLQDGKPVISDFGIALAVGAAGGGRLTETGLSLGTPYYMSPEQATGDVGVGAATDVYAAACVLYEMLVGEPPYTAGTPQAILGKIIAGALSSASEQRASVPANVDAAIRKALEKVPADRFRGARQFATALADPGFTDERASTAAASAAASAAGRNRSTLALAVAAGVFGILAAFGWLRPDASPDAPTPLALALDLGAVPQPLANQVTISPDGTRFAVPTDGPVYVRGSAQEGFTALSGTEGVQEVTFSPDGEWVAYVQGGAIRKMAVSGSSPVTLATVVTGSDPNLHWGESGSIVFAALGGLRMISEDGGELIELDVTGLHPHLLPDGRGILYEDQGAIRLFDLATSRSTDLVSEGTEPVYVPTGHILFAHPAGGLFAVAFDLDTREVQGGRVPVVNQVSVTGVNANYSVARNGTLLYGGGGNPLESDQRFILLSPDGSVEPVRVEPRVLSFFQFSPDGNSIAFNEGTNRTSLRTVFTHDLVLGTTNQVTFDGGEHQPVWSPDGTELAYSVQLEAGAAAEDIYVRPANGDGAPRRVVTMPGDEHTEAWTKSGLIVFSAAGDLYTVDASATDGTPQPYLTADYGEANVEISPDGRLAAYVSNEAGEPDVYIRSFPEPGGQRRVTTGGGDHPFWNADGTTLFYQKADTIFAARLRTEPSLSVEAVEVAWIVPNIGGQTWDFDPVSGRALVAQFVDVDSTDEPTGVTVVVNWFEELRELMGN